jgi:hypothetical protein
MRLARADCLHRGSRKFRPKTLPFLAFTRTKKRLESCRQFVFLQPGKGGITLDSRELKCLIETEGADNRRGTDRCPLRTSLVGRIIDSRKKSKNTGGLEAERVLKPRTPHVLNELGRANQAKFTLP